MATTYRQAGDLIKALVDKVMTQCHVPLKEAGVTVNTVIAAKDSKRDGAMVALKQNGIPIAAKMGIVSLQDRSRGVEDAKLVIDDYAWDRLSSTRREALIDHELQHLALVMIRPTKKNGYQKGVKFDDLSRPCLRIRPHDWELSGFQAVVERHQEESIEAFQFATFKDEYGQLNLFGPSTYDVVSRSVKGGKTRAEVEKQYDKLTAPSKFSDLKLGIELPISYEGAQTATDTLTSSSACRNRKHKTCKGPCGCDCHKGEVEAQ